MLTDTELRLQLRWHLLPYAIQKKWMVNGRCGISLTTLFSEAYLAGLEACDKAPLLSDKTREIETILAWASHQAHHIITRDDVHYPEALKHIEDSPHLLYVKGDVSLLSRPQLAMVGTRHPSAYGISVAEQFAKALASVGLVITSGLAKGIDTVSHESAWRAGGETIGVAGTGLCVNYPASNRELIERMVAERGACLSEFPLMTPPRPENFPKRNRIISGLSLGVLVVEAALRSGSLIHARTATEQGREVFAIPGSIHNEFARGCHALIRQGAKCVDQLVDILEELHIDAMCKPKIQPHQSPNLSANAKQLFDHMGTDIQTMDMLLLQSHLPPGEISSILLELEMENLVQAMPGGYQRTQ